MEAEQQRATSEESLQSTSLSSPNPPTPPTQTREKHISSNQAVAAPSISRGVVGRRPRSGSWRGTSRKGSPGSTPSRYYYQSGTQFFFLQIICNIFPSQARAKERVLRNTEVGRGLVTKMGQEASTPEMDKYNLHVEEVNTLLL